MWQAQVFTLYPEVFPGPLSKGLYGKALSNNLWKLKVVNIRDAEIGRAHVRTPVTEKSRMPSSA